MSAIAFDIKSVMVVLTDVVFGVLSSAKREWWLMYEVDCFN